MVKKFLLSGRSGQIFEAGTVFPKDNQRSGCDTVLHQLGGVSFVSADYIRDIDNQIAAEWVVEIDAARQLLAAAHGVPAHSRRIVSTENDPATISAADGTLQISAQASAGFSQMLLDSSLTTGNPADARKFHQQFDDGGTQEFTMLDQDGKVLYGFEGSCVQHERTCFYMLNDGNGKPVASVHISSSEPIAPDSHGHWHTITTLDLSTVSFHSKPLGQVIIDKHAETPNRTVFNIDLHPPD